MSDEFVVLRWGRTYKGPDGTLYRFYPYTETQKAVGIIRPHKARKLLEQAEKIAPGVYETPGGTRFVHLGDGFIWLADAPIWWLPKSQIEFDESRVVIPKWLARKNGLDLLEEVREE